MRELFGLVQNFFFPLGDQPATFGAGAVFGVVVVDQLHFGGVDHARINWHRAVAWKLKLFGRQSELLATRRQRPFIKLLGRLGVRAIFDNAH